MQTKFPSVKKIVDRLKLTKEEAIELRKYMKLDAQHGTKVAFSFLSFTLGAKSGFFGTETFKHKGKHYTYANTGETYQSTLIKQTKGNYFISSWGDIVES